MRLRRFKPMFQNKFLALAALGLTAQEASAISFRLPNQDPEAIARGNRHLL
jgi:hypothetical protein